MVRVAFCIGGYPPEEFKRRADVALSYSNAEVEVGIVNVGASPYIYGMTPTEVTLVAAFVDAYRRAENEGYDAVVPLGMLDFRAVWMPPGRSAVGHPGDRTDAGVLARGRSARRPLRSDYLSREKLSPLTERPCAVTAWKIASSVLAPAVSNYQDITANRDAVVKNFVDEAKRLINLGAEVIIPMGITQCPVHIKPKWLQEQLGVRVVGGLGAPIRMAALLAGLGLKHSRVRWPKSAGGSK